MILSATVQAYAGRVERHVLPRLAERQLDEIKVDDIAALVAELRKAGYSGTTIATTLNLTFGEVRDVARPI